MADKANLVQVEIFGQTYSVKAGGDAGYVQKLAAFVDEEMKDVSRASGAVDSLRVAVLAALNLADECFRLRQEGEDKQASGARSTSGRCGSPRGWGGPRRVGGLCSALARGGVAAIMRAEALCSARDGFGNLEPTSSIRGSDSPRGEHASASRKPEARLRTPTL